MADNFREELRRAAGELGINPVEPKEAEKIDEIRVGDTVFLRPLSGLNGIWRHKNPDGSFYQHTQEEINHVGSSGLDMMPDLDHGFMVKNIIHREPDEDDPDDDTVFAELLPRKYSNKKDEGTTYLAPIERLQKSQ